MLTKNKQKEKIARVVKRILENWGWDAECDRCGARYDGLYFPPDVLDEAIEEIAEEITEEIINLKEEEDG